MVTETALQVIEEEPRVVRLGQTGPTDTIELATRMATALADIVEKQKLYSVINKKKFPQVEAWMTIGRMDNVVAREAEPPIRHEDGSYEAFVELIRLSDGMVIGRGSALCGTARDGDWTNRSDPVKRSMAVTRATSRAFRQQYSWIMVLAGYEPTPADEMPPEGREEPRNVTGDPYDKDNGAAETRTTHRDGLVGKAIAQGTQDFELRQHPDKGFTLPFRLKEGRLNQIVLAQGELALQLADVKDMTLGELVTVWGHYDTQEFPKKDGSIVTYNVLFAERVKVPDGRVLPVVSPLRAFAEKEGIVGPNEQDVIPVAEGQEALFDQAESDRLDREAAAAG
jgi:hypothetical protein